MPQFNVFLSVNINVEAEDEVDAIVQARELAISDTRIATIQVSSTEPQGALPPSPPEAVEPPRARQA
jgi:hypothetical protein